MTSYCKNGLIYLAEDGITCAVDVNGHFRKMRGTKNTLRSAQEFFDLAERLAAWVRGGLSLSRGGWA